MSRNVKSLLTLLLVLLFLIGISIIPFPTEAGNNLAVTPSQVEAVHADAN